MPAMTMLGWFHTIMGVLALLLAIAAIRNHGFIRSTDREGAAYLVVTVVVAGSALGIYNQGGFGIAHYLAVLTLAAALGGLYSSGSICLVVSRCTFRRLPTARQSCFT